MNRDPISSLKNVRECLLCSNPMYTVHENENMICDACQKVMEVNTFEVKTAVLDSIKPI